MRIYPFINLYNSIKVRIFKNTKDFYKIESEFARDNLPKVKI